jgi:hypothetical protein
MRRQYRLTALFCVILGINRLVAQDLTCPAIVQTALQATDQACEGLGRNQACYGNVTLQAVPQTGVTEFAFDKAGDRVDVDTLDSLTLSSLDAGAGEWGVALMQIQANVPDTLPGQNVTFVLFGDVEIENAVTEDTEATETAEPEYKPMQAFYFKSGFNDAPCTEAPDSGILIQTPQGAGTIDLVMNEVNVSLGSTVYVQAQPDGEMVINVIEGEATVSALGATVIVPAGTRARVLLDADLAASGAPVGPEPYDEGAFVALPISLLTEEIEVAPALVQDDTEVMVGLPTPGIYTISGTYTPVGECVGLHEFALQAASITIEVEPGVEIHFAWDAFPSDATDLEIIFSNPQFYLPSSLRLDLAPSDANSLGLPADVTTTNPAPGTYVITSLVQGDGDTLLDSTITQEMRLVSTTRIEGNTTWESGGVDCVYTWTYALDYVEP